jgi:hypothetical protein
MKEIKLSGKSGLITFVSDIDYDFLIQWKWYPVNNGYTTYVYRKKGYGRKGSKTVYMHNEIMNPPKEHEVDHVNMNGLDNQRENLRVCTKSQNISHRPNSRRGVVPYRGVHIIHVGKYTGLQVRITVNNKGIHLASLPLGSEIGGAKIYDKYARLYHGEFAVLNFPDEKE